MAVRAALALALGVIEAAWLWPWALLLGRWADFDADRPLLESATVLALLLTAQGLARVLRAGGWRIGAAQACVVTAGVLAAFVVASREHGLPSLPTVPLVELPRALVPPTTGLSAFGLALVVWHRGLAHGRGRVGFDELEGAFRRGLFGLVLFLGVAAVTLPASYHAVQATVAPYALGLFFVALSALAFARLQAVDRLRGQAGRLAVDRHWFGVMLGVVVGLLLFAVVAAQLLSLDRLGDATVLVLRPVAIAISAIMLILAIPIAYLILYLLEMVRELIRRRGEREGEPGFDLSSLRELFERGSQREPPPELVLVSEWLALIVATTLAVLVLARALRWWLDRRVDDDVEEERESVWSWSAAGAALLAWLSGLFSGRRRLAVKPAATRPEAATAAPRTGSIRAIYRQVLALAAARGRTRRPSTTPREHLPALQGALDPDDDLALITEAYLIVRYGAADQPVDDLAVAAGWERVQAATGQAFDVDGGLLAGSQS